MRVNSLGTWEAVLTLWRLIWPQVEVLRPAPDQENMTPRRVLDQQGSNDFAAYLQETAGSPMLRCRP
jgi:hypothetical protein